MNLYHKHGKYIRITVLVDSFYYVLYSENDVYKSIYCSRFVVYKRLITELSIGFLTV